VTLWSVPVRLRGGGHYSLHVKGLRGRAGRPPRSWLEFDGVRVLAALELVAARELKKIPRAHGRDACPVEAGDLVQEAIVQLLQHRDSSYREPMPFDRLCRILRGFVPKVAAGLAQRRVRRNRLYAVARGGDQLPGWAASDGVCGRPRRDSRALATQRG